MTDPNLRLRTVTVTIKHTESQWKEEKTVNLQYDDRTDQFELVKVFCLELGKEVLFCKNTNEILLPD
ncbi:hypothetical protein [Leptolyngbya ohadii]|uniref:hypothetical protein n=1 Tax=Leptolyngbya ohadii TaxID=1962290 RepID=UPI000B59B15A|nr:hypothetical protein [Leptolyngbya ohadii]